jgi:hypothetical protein
MMQGPGAEYLVILSDRQLREGVMRQQSRTPHQAISFNWIRQLWLKLVTTERAVPHEPAPQPSQPQLTARAAPLFGASE